MVDTENKEEGLLHNDFPEIFASLRVAVVGAGIAGLAAASYLVQQGFDQVFLVEASDYVGGRLKQVEPFPGFPPVDLGGDFIHGSNSILNKLAKDNNWTVKNSHRIDGEHVNTIMYFLDGKLYSSCGSNQPDITAAHGAWDGILDIGEELTNNPIATTCTNVQRDSCDHDNLRFETSLSTWLAGQGLSQNTIDVIDCIYCQVYAGTLDKMGVLACAKDEICWDYGDENYRLEGSYSVLISSYLTKCMKVDKRLNWPVKEIKWAVKQPTEQHDGSGVVITSQHGESLAVDYAVVTVPLSILKDGDILFSPSLPANKQHAINTIYMGAALKIVCRFKIPFWRKISVVYAVRGFVSQIWSYSREPREDGEECHVAVGFQTAADAAQKVHLTEKEVCEKFLQQLDGIFGSEAVPSPASDNFINSVYYHWSKHPYIRGGYSAPTAHGLRHALAEPIGGRLFFAGEATHLTVVATVQSAIETGIRAAQEICEEAMSESTRITVQSSQ